MKPFLGIRSKRKRRTKRYVPHSKLTNKNTEVKNKGNEIFRGISHRVIIVKSPDKIFDEAIFVIREDVLNKVGTDSNYVLNEARRIANSYIKNTQNPKNKLTKKLWAPLLVVAGATITGLVWLILHLWGI